LTGLLRAGAVRRNRVELPPPLPPDPDARRGGKLCVRGGERQPGVGQEPTARSL